MHSFDATFHRLLQGRIREEIERERSNVTDKAVPRRQYLYRVGHISGLSQALQLCEEIEQKMQGIK